MNTHDSYRFNCEECGKGCHFLKDFNQHKKIHDKDRDTYKCSICGQKYMEKSSLKKHVSEVHTNVKYYCNKCPKAYTQEGNLDRHLDTHEPDYIKDVKIECNICQEKFANQNNLKDHMKSRHDIKDRFSCDICQAEVFKKSFKSHRILVHSEESIPITFTLINT